MTEEEFQDSQILFPEKTSSGNRKEIPYPKVETRNPDKKPQKKSSVPMTITEEFPGGSWARDYLGKEEIVPPHVMLAQRIAGKEAFSLCSGNGRTLKGRDLSEVRNSILKMTGFLES